MNDEPFHLVWLRGSDCDGCTISMLGDTSADGRGIEDLQTGTVPGVPTVRLYHPALYADPDTAFVDNLESVERGERTPYGIVLEASVPADAAIAPGFYASLGEDRGRIIAIGEWLDRLAPDAAFVLAFGDCACWGGPHSLGPNPTGATGTGVQLGIDYRSTLGLPVVNFPGCAAPSVLIESIARLLRWMRDAGPPLELDRMNRPAFAYKGPWEGSLSVWQG